MRQSLQEHAASSSGRVAPPEAKNAVLRDIYPYVTRMNSQVQREESLRLIADLVGTDVDAVRRDFSTLARPTRARGPRESSSPVSPAAGAPSAYGTKLSHDLFLMLATVRNRGQYAYVRRFVQPEDLEDDAAKEICLALEEAFRRDEQSLDALLERITKPGIAEVIRRRIASEEFALEDDQSVRDAVLAIRRRALMKQRRAVEIELRRVAAGSDPGNDYRDLLSEKMLLDRELQKLKGEG